MTSILQMKWLVKNEDKVAANWELHKCAVSDFCALVDSQTPGKFAELWAANQAAYAKHPEWLCYMEAEWISKKEDEEKHGAK